MVSQAVLNFMKIQNRPFSLSDIMQNIGKEHGKTAVEKAVNKLIEQNKLFEKLYGKQKVYCIVQDDTDLSNLEDDLKRIDREINEVSKNLKEKEHELQSKVDEINSLQKKMTIAEAERNIAELKEEIQSLKEKINRFSENEIEPISPKTKIKIVEEYEKYVTLYKKRKRMCKDMVDTILEGYPKTKKQLFEEIGIETDEDAGFTLQEIPIKK